MNNINLLPAIITFAEVVKLGSFTGAAKSLGLSKAAISLQVKRLEEHVGQELLTRNTRSMSLTAVGKTIFERSELLHGQVNRALGELDLAKSNPTGRFSVTIPHTLEADIVMPALKQLCIEYPLIEPHINVSDETLDLIDSGFDIAIRGGNMKDSAYKAQLIGSAKEVFCASPTYIAEQGVPQGPAQLLSCGMVAAPWQKNVLQLKNEGDKQLRMYSAKFVATSNNFSSTLAMVKNDMGVALLPEFTVYDEIAKGRLLRIFPELQGREWPFYFVHRFAKDRPRHIHRFYQLIKHYFTNATKKQIV